MNRGLKERGREGFKKKLQPKDSRKGWDWRRMSLVQFRRGGGMVPDLCLGGRQNNN